MVARRSDGSGAGPYAAGILTADDELRHPHPPGDPHVTESFLLDFAGPDPALGGSVGLAFTGAGACAFWACLARPGRQLLTIVEAGLAAPRDLELRAPGLWAEVQCLVPFDHVTVGLEAFAVGLDDPDDALGRLWGDRVPFGLDLEWDTAGPVVPTQGDGDTDGEHGYEIRCAVHGEVLVADERIELDGFGSRRHRWGRGAPWGGAEARTVTAAGVGVAEPPGRLLARAPMRLDLGAHGCVRLDRALVVGHDAAGAPEPGMLAWTERSMRC